MGAERRQYNRYVVEGQALFRTTDAVEASGYLLDVAVGGMLVRSAVVPAEGTQVWVHFSFDRHPEAFITRGRIVRAQPDGLAGAFPGRTGGAAKDTDCLAERTQSKGPSLSVASVSI